MGRMHGFRPGIGLLAAETEAAVLPVGLRGLYDYASERSAEGRRRRWFHAGRVEVRVGAVAAGGGGRQRRGGGDGADRAGGAGAGRGGLMVGRGQVRAGFFLEWTLKFSKGELR